MKIITLFFLVTFSIIIFIEEISVVSAQTKSDTSIDVLTSMLVNNKNKQQNNYGILLNNGAIIVGKSILNAGSISGNGIYYLSYNWINNGIFVANLSSITFNGNLAQSIQGSNSTIFNNLRLNNSMGLSYINCYDATINGIFTLMNGNFDLGNNNLIIGSDATIIQTSEDSNHMIIQSGSGVLTKKGNNNINASFTFPIGDNFGNLDYSPITLTFNGGTYSGSSSVKVMDVKHPHDASTTNYLTRYWTISQTGYSGFYCNISATYLSSDINSNNEALITTAKWDSILPWVKCNAVNNTNHNLIANNITSFSDIGGIDGSLNVEINSSPSDANLCKGKSTVVLNGVSSGGASPVTNIWAPTIGLSPSIGAVVIANPLLSTTYIYMAKDANGITASDSVPVIVNEPHNINGTINYYNNALTPMTNTTINLFRNETFQSTYVVTNAYYEFIDMCPGSYNFRISSTISTEGSVNGTDAAQVNAFPSNFCSIEKVRFYSGDVVGITSPLLNSTDAQRIMNHFVNETPFERPEWTFWIAGDHISCNSANAEFNSPLIINSSDSNIITTNIYALCTGDFNRSFIPNLNKSANNKVNLLNSNRIKVKNSELIEIPIKVEESYKIGAISLILDYPSDKIEIESVVMNSNNGSYEWATIGNELRIAWFSSDALYLNKGETLLKLNIKLKRLINY